MRNLEKSIYGLAATWYEPLEYPEDETAGTVFKFIDKAGIRFDGLVGMTIEHDYSRVLGTTDKGMLSLYLNDTGLYFKLIVDEANKLAVSSYKKVKRGALRKASVSYDHSKDAVKRMRDYEETTNMLCIAHGLDTDNALYLTNPYTLFEICLCNVPRNSQTFLSTDPNDSRFNGIDWNNPITIPNNPSVMRTERFKHRFDREVWMQSETEAIRQELKELKKQTKTILGGSKR